MNCRRHPVAVLFDADNTLYDWVHYFAASLRSAVYDLSSEVGIPMSEIQRQLRGIFCRHGTVEYPFYLPELESLLSVSLSPEEVDSFYEAQAVRASDALRPYPGVLRGISRLREAGVRTICVSDASRCHLLYRLDKLGLASCFDAIYCAPDYPVEERFESRRRQGVSEILQRAPGLRVEHFPVGLRKPSPEILKRVLGDLDLDAGDCVFLGDNLSKDIAMAKVASVFDCWASYGLPRLVPDLTMLVSVTDWSPEDVDKFYLNRPEMMGIEPSHVAESFEQFVSWVLRNWSERTYIAMPTPHPEQLSLLDVPGAPV